METTDPDKTLALIDAYLTGTADEQQQADLFAMLSTDQSVRQLYLQYVDIHAALKWTFKGPSESNIPSDDELRIAESAFNLFSDKNVASVIAVPDNPQDGGASTTGNALPLPPIAQNNSGFPLFGFSPSLFFGVSFLIIAIGISSVYLWRAPVEQQNSNQLIATNVNNSAFKPMSWKIETGSTTMDLAKIGHIVLEAAPGESAEFVMLSPMRGRLTKGKIKVRITEETGHGFKVETPTSVVTDLGTEFLLNVSAIGGTDLAVIEGEVDFQVSHPTDLHKIDDMPSERLVQGDGVKVDGDGNVDRIMTITRGKAATFQTAHELAESNLVSTAPLILSVTDNLRASDTKRFYEIVPGGFDEDVPAYVDRTYEWNGVSKKGLPEFLRGADYIRMFNDDKWKEDMSVTVTISRAATIYVLFDDRGSSPSWLEQNFKPTGFKVGMDENLPSKFADPVLGKGAGNSIDYVFSVWAREVKETGPIELGPRGPGAPKFAMGRSMYGVVVVPLEDPKMDIQKKSL